MLLYHVFVKNTNHIGLAKLHLGKYHHMPLAIGLTFTKLVKDNTNPHHWSKFFPRDLNLTTGDYTQITSSAKVHRGMAPQLVSLNVFRILI